MIKIYKKVEIDAAHFLRHMPEGHQCARLHGHHYVIEVEIVAPSSDNLRGMVVDFGEISQAVKFYDHCCLNETYHFEKVLNPTAENLALILSRNIRKLIPVPFHTLLVRVWETPTSYAEVTDEA